LTLIYANKEWDQVTFRDELEQLKNKLNLNIVHVLEKVPLDWLREKGFINQEILLKSLPDFKQRNRMEIFIFGPAPMMNAVKKTLDHMGVWSGDFHSERFDLA